MLNADESFVVKSITRAQIAEDLNSRLSQLADSDAWIAEEAQVSPDDSRLTHDICVRYADFASRLW